MKNESITLAYFFGMFSHTPYLKSVLVTAMGNLYQVYILD